MTFLLRSGERYSLAELLPVRFRPGDLLDEAVTSLLLQPQRHELQLLPGGLLSMQPACMHWQFHAPHPLHVVGFPGAHEALGTASSDASLQSAAHAALEAARSCYAPYTHSASGAAIVTSSGEVFRSRTPVSHALIASRAVHGYDI